EVDEHARAVFGEPQRDGPADSAPGAGDHDLATIRGHGAPRVSIGDCWSTRTVSRSRSPCALSSPVAGTIAKSSVADATRRPSTSHAALTVHAASFPVARVQRTRS